MRIKILSTGLLMSILFLGGCQTDLSKYIPTNITYAGVYAAELPLNNINLILREDGTGVVCEVPSTGEVKIRDVLVTGDTLRDTFDFKLEETSYGLSAKGFMNIEYIKVGRPYTKCKLYL